MYIAIWLINQCRQYHITIRRIVFHNFYWKFRHVSCLYKMYFTHSHSWTRWEPTNICTDILQKAKADVNFIKLLYFLAHKTHSDFFVRNFRKKKYGCILILVIYWKETGLLHTKISNHNINYSSQKPRKSSSLPLKSPSWLFSLDAGMGIYKFRNNIYPQRIRRRSNLGHIFRGKKCVLWAGKYGAFCPRK